MALAGDEPPAPIHVFHPLRPSSTASPDVEATAGLGLGVRRELLVPVLRGIIKSVEEIRDAVAHTEMRMAGASLLVSWEGDEARLEEALAAASALGVGSDGAADTDMEPGRMGRRRAEEMLEAAPSRIGDLGGRGRQSGDLEQKSPGSASSAEGAAADAGSAASTSSSSSSASSSRSIGPPFTVHLIDFAHTTATPGRGPDEGVLKGLETMMALLRGRVESLG